VGEGTSRLFDGKPSADCHKQDAGGFLMLKLVIVMSFTRLLKVTGTKLLFINNGLVERELDHYLAKLWITWWTMCIKRHYLNKRPFKKVLNLSHILKKGVFTCNLLSLLHE